MTFILDEHTGPWITDLPFTFAFKVFLPSRLKIYLYQNTLGKDNTFDID